MSGLKERLYSLVDDLADKQDDIDEVQTALVDFAKDCEYRLEGLDDLVNRFRNLASEIEEPELNLKPCPFCGGIKDVEVWCEDSQFTVACNASTGRSGCGATSGFTETKEQAALEWNRRV